MRMEDLVAKAVSLQCCTFAITQTTLVKQRWFLCRTCNGYEERNIGCCQSCAAVCHKGHDVIESRWAGTSDRFHSFCFLSIPRRSVRTVQQPNIAHAHAQPFPCCRVCDSSHDTFHLLVLSHFLILYLPIRASPARFYCDCGQGSLPFPCKALKALPADMEKACDTHRSMSCAQATTADGAKEESLEKKEEEEEPEERIYWAEDVFQDDGK